MKKKLSKPKKVKSTGATSKEASTQSFPLPDLNVHVVAPKDIWKYYGDPNDPEKNSYARIRTRMKEDFDWLVQRALMHGDKEAVLVLAEIGIDAAGFLDHMSRICADLVKGVSRNLAAWPVIISPEPNAPRHPAAIRKQLEIGQAISVRSDKVLYRGKDKFQRQVMFQTLAILNGSRTLTGAYRKMQQLGAILEKFSSDKNSEETIAAAALYLALLRGERGKAEGVANFAIARVKNSKSKLYESLAIPVPPAGTKNPEISKILEQACQLPELSKASENDWLDLVIAFLVALTGNELEENPRLRALGEPSGDVVIRTRCKGSTSDEFNRRKVELRRDPGVNGAIRTRIKQKLGPALAAFCS